MAISIRCHDSRNETYRRHRGGRRLVGRSNLLGISRNTLRAKLRGLGLSVEKQLIPETDQEV
jgi:DNA-binding NtrC family response regulator